jgi:hypothetical protein
MTDEALLFLGTLRDDVISLGDEAILDPASGNSSSCCC